MIKRIGLLVFSILLISCDDNQEDQLTSGAWVRDEYSFSRENKTEHFRFLPDHTYIFEREERTVSQLYQMQTMYMCETLKGDWVVQDHKILLKNSHVQIVSYMTLLTPDPIILPIHPGKRLEMLYGHTPTSDLNVWDLISFNVKYTDLSREGEYTFAGIVPDQIILNIKELKRKQMIIWCDHNWDERRYHRE